MHLLELADDFAVGLRFPARVFPCVFYFESGKAKAIRFSTLNAICGALSCQPGDILRFEPGAEREPASNKENFK